MVAPNHLAQSRTMVGPCVETALRRRAMVRFLAMALRLAVAWVVLAACSMGDTPATQVLVHVTFDAEVLAQGRTLRLQVWDGAGQSTYDQQFVLADVGSSDAPVTLPITATDDDATRRWRYAATVIGSDLQNIGQVRAEGGYFAGERREVRLHFDAACLDRLCGARSSCEHGQCVDACVTPSPPGAVERSPSESCSSRCRPVTAVGVGGRSVCAVADGELWCWGDNRFGQVSGAGEEFVTRPHRIGVHADWHSASVSEEYVCAIREQGAVHCWGLNSDDGRLGTGSNADVPCCEHRLPRSFLQVATGRNHACAIREEGSLWCWGEADLLGRTGITPGCGGDPDPCRPVRVDDNTWLFVAAGMRHTCAARDVGGEVRLYCWGDNDHGQLGQPLSVGYAAEPTLVEGAHDWSHVTAAGDHTCGIGSGGQARCWGDDRGDQTGCVPREADNQPAPCEPATGTTIADIAIGVADSGGSSGHTCAASSDGQVWCWGTNEFAETDPFQPDSTLRPPALVPIRDGLRFETVGAGFRHSCALSDLGALYCWGRNTRGELAVGDQAQFYPPQPVCVK